MGKIYFKDQKGIRLCGIISDPASGRQDSIVILCHGFGSSKEGRTYRGLERIFNKGNVSTFRFDFFGHGESEGKFEDVTVSKAISEVLSAIFFVRNQDYERIGLVGGSFGGLASMVAASKSEDLSTMALKSPVSDFDEVMSYGKWKEKRGDARKRGYAFYENKQGEERRLNYSFFKDAGRINGYKFAKNIRVPTLVVHGDQDESVKVEQSRKLARVIPDCRLEIIKGADHRYTVPKHFEKMLNLISQFVTENL